MPELDLSMTNRGVAAQAQRLRETRMRLRAIKHGTTQQLIINLLGDSWVQGDYWSNIFAKALHTEYGMAGVGWVGFGFFLAGTPPYVTGGAQPNSGGTPTVDGNARPDLVAKPTFDGTWGSAGATNGYNRSGSGLPSLSYAESSTVGDRARFTFPAGHTSAQVFYQADVAGSFRYSWDGGSTWQTTISYSAASGALSAALANTPAGAATIILEVVSGTVRLGGVDMRSTAAGVRVHKLGSSGSATNTWNAAAAAGSWKSRIIDLGAHLNMVGFQTNDQGAAYDPATTYTTQLGTIIANLRVATPYCDILLTSPPENQRVANAYPMAQYTTATRALANAQNCAHLDHQFNFGLLPADYAWANAGRKWMAADLVHPDAPTGGAILADGALETLRPR